jgi:hypothetical protein
MFGFQAQSLGVALPMQEFAVLADQRHAVEIPGLADTAANRGGIALGEDPSPHHVILVQFQSTAIENLQTRAITIKGPALEDRQTFPAAAGGWG